MEYSVIIPTHNRPELVVRAIRSVLAQRCAAAEILIIDDASQPPLVLPPELCDGRTRVLRNEKSAGGAAARNAGLREARCEIVAFLDDDDEWLPEKMELQLAWLEANPEAALVTCGYLRLEGGRQYIEGFSREFIQRYRQYDNFFGSFSYLVVRRPGSGIFLDPALPALQDWDFALRATRTRPFGVIDQPLVKYHAHDLPRITNRVGNHLRGLRHFYLSHRKDLTADARRWLLGRMSFERSKCAATWSRRLAGVAFSISLSAGCRVPLNMKLRSIGRRAASLCISPRTVIQMRSALIAASQGMRRSLSVAPAQRVAAGSRGI